MPNPGAESRCGSSFESLGERPHEEESASVLIEQRSRQRRAEFIEPRSGITQTQQRSIGIPVDHHLNQARRVFDR